MSTTDACWQPRVTLLLWFALAFGGCNETPGKVVFVAAGHVRANPVDSGPELQAGFLRSLDGLAKDSSALFLTGDVTYWGGEAQWQQIDQLVKNRVKIPVHIALGNHDIAKGRVPHKQRYESSYYSGSIDGVTYVVLDTELPGRLSHAPQLALIRSVTEGILADTKTTALIVFMHRVEWIVDAPSFQGVAKWMNGSTRQAVDAGGGGFWTEVVPLLKKVREKIPVAVVAGDVGTQIPLLYAEIDGLKLVASGNGIAPAGELTWNHYLAIEVTSDGIHFRPIPTGEFKFSPIETYSTDYWVRNPPEARVQGAQATKKKD